MDSRIITGCGGGGRGRLGGRGLSQKEKGLMDMDNSVVIAGEREYKRTKWQ